MEFALIVVLVSIGVVCLARVLLDYAQKEHNYWGLVLFLGSVLGLVIVDIGQYQRLQDQNHALSELGIKKCMTDEVCKQDFYKIHLGK